MLLAPESSLAFSTENGLKVKKPFILRVLFQYCFFFLPNILKIRTKLITHKCLCTKRLGDKVTRSSQPGTVAQSCSSSTREAEAEGFEFGPSLRLLRKTLSQTTTKRYFRLKIW